MDPKSQSQNQHKNEVEDVHQMSSCSQKESIMEFAEAETEE